MKYKRFLKVPALILCLMALCTGCGPLEEKTKVILTTGFDADELFRIETMSCHLPEVMVYLTNTQNRYEKIYGAQIWETDLKGAALEENVKETILAEIAQVKVMNLLAEEYEVTLTEKEAELAQTAGKEYYSSLSAAEIEALYVDENIMISMYKEYALADKVYHYIIKDINPEISDDEARTITVQHILIKTYMLDRSGQQVPYREEQKLEAFDLAQEICRRAKGGEDFEQLVSEYNEDSRSTYSFGKGEMDPVFEHAAFELGNGEISDVIETGYGYHVIKCLSTFNKEETDANKIKIVEQRRKEVFSQEYDAFADSLTRKLNDGLWEEISMIHNSEVDTTEFFQIYSSYFDRIFES